LCQNEQFKALVPQRFLFLFSNIIGGMIAGGIGTFVTHPFDTWKTRCQAGMPVNFWPQEFHFILRKSLRKEGLDPSLLDLFKNLLVDPYKGFIPRCTRVVAAVAFLNLFNASAEKYLEQYK